MISFEEAYNKVLQNTLKLGDERVRLSSCMGRILAEDVVADRDFPPFNRSTKDGIAIHFSAIENGITRFKVEGVLSAGMAQQVLTSSANCLEIMTGAVLPLQADTIIMYEETEIENGWATISKTPKKGQNIHSQGSDKRSGELLLAKDIQITAAVVGVLASVGKTEVRVKKKPSVCVVSTGNELVEVSESPLPHQIRKSNSLSLSAALGKLGIVPKLLHLADDKALLEKELEKALLEYDVLMLSGGVSKGKFDFIPDALDTLGVQKIFHRVAQRPGKPFWFGIQEGNHKVVFSFPGNPVSTFANYHVYFLPWFAKSLDIKIQQRTVVLDEAVQPHPTLSLFLQVATNWHDSRLHANLVEGNGSGDLVSLAQADGFVMVPKGNVLLPIGTTLSYIPVV